MTTNQIKNLVNFSFNFHSDSDIDIKHLSPSYVIEKWDFYINVDIKNADIYLIDDKIVFDLKQWVNTWGINESGRRNKAMSIYQFILSINQKSITDKDFNISFLLSEIKKIIYVNKIETELYNNLHPIINKNINVWLERKVNKRHLKLSKLL